MPARAISRKHWREATARPSGSSAAAARYIVSRQVQKSSWAPAGRPGLGATAEEPLEGVAVRVHQAGEEQLAGEALDRGVRRRLASALAGPVGGDGERHATLEAAPPDEGLGLEPAGRHGRRAP